MGFMDIPFFGFRRFVFVARFFEKLAEVSKSHLWVGYRWRLVLKIFFCQTVGDNLIFVRG